MHKHIHVKACLMHKHHYTVTLTWLLLSFLFVSLLTLPTMTLKISNIHNHDISCKKTKPLENHDHSACNTQQESTIDLISSLESSSWSSSTLRMYRNLQQTSIIPIISSNITTNNATNSTQSNLGKAASTQSPGSLAALILAPTIIIGLTLVIVILIAMCMIIARRKEVLERKNGSTQNHHIVKSKQVELVVNEGL